tara:strand:- start:811 stop:1047 length:237 start_codon:yes stop_codon:yes gene_type:complete
MSESQPIIYSEPSNDGMSATDVSMVVAGVAAALASIIYSLKHVKKSRCCGASCEQEVVEDEEELEKGDINKNNNITEV